MSSIVFIDSRVSDIDRLLSGLAPDVQVVILDPAQDGVTQISAALGGVTDLDSIHIISHGSEGTLYIGSTILTEDNLDAYETELSQIGASLSREGDILLYGCDIGAGTTGQSFVASLASYTSADVAASTDLTGSATQGGDWVLEASSGLIDTATPLDAAAQENYPNTLATTYSLTPTSTTVNEGAGTQSFTVTRSGGLPAETIYASTTQTEGFSNSGDYTSILNQNVVFALNQTQATVTVSITNDTAVESNETFGLIVQRNSNDPDTTFLDKSTFTIQDNDTTVIRIESRPVEIFGQETFADHLYLVLDGPGQDLVISGGPKPGTFAGDPLTLQINIEIEESLDRRGNDSLIDRGSHILNLDGRNAEDVWAIMVQHAQNIQNAQLDFIPLSQNSNSTVASVLNSVGIVLTSNFPTNTSAFDIVGEENLLGINTTLIGTRNADRIQGYTGNDTLDGAGGEDTMVGGAGNDTYVVDSALDVVTEALTAGTDLVQSSVTIAALAANVEKLTLTGTGAINGTGNTLNNTITGNSGANQLAGGAGNDTLTGSAGNDKLNGGTGNDAFSGGPGNDTLNYHAADTSVQGGTGADTLRINGGGVVLDLTLITNTVHTDIEKINLTGSGNNTLTLARADVLAISSTTDTLKIIGNAGDSVNAGSGWTDFGISGAYHEYQKSGAILLVDTDITQNIFP